MIALRLLAAPVVVAMLLGGCSRDHELRCEPSDRYARASSTDPVRVPDDLTPPDERDALQLPSSEPGSAGGAEKTCLESPPVFTPGNAAGRSRNGPEPAPPAPPASGDREIGN